MGDQIAPGDQIADQISSVTKIRKLGFQSGRLERFGHLL